MLKRIAQIVLVAGLVSACAETTVTPVSRNEILISTSTASGDCSPSATMKVAGQMAAVETLRRGFVRYKINAAGTQNNSAIGHIPNYGGSGFGTFFDAGSNEAQLRVLMLNPRDPGFEDGIDAKVALGDGWQEHVENGISYCT